MKVLLIYKSYESLFRNYLSPWTVLGKVSTFISCIYYFPIDLCVIDLFRRSLKNLSSFYCLSHQLFLIFPELTMLQCDPRNTRYVTTSMCECHFNNE